MAVKKKAVTAKAAPAKRSPVSKAKAPKAARTAVTQAQAASAAPPAVAATNKPGEARYLLPANMEIASLGQVHADLLQLSSDNDSPFTLDGANLSVIDAAGLQLLLSFVSTLNARGRKVSWDNYSVQAYQLANELGVVEQLGD
jgi:anti-anti-sigma regulatory factor